jgi:hypothetical protein
VLTQEDINKTLQSPAVAARLRVIGSRILGGSPDRYEFINPQVEFLDNNRSRFQVEVREKDAQPLVIMVESGLGIVGGRSLQLVEPTVSINGRPLSPPLVSAFSRGIGDRFNLRTLEEAGITARFLKLRTDNKELEIAAFVRVDASKQASASNTGSSSQ